MTHYKRLSLLAAFIIFALSCRKSDPVSPLIVTNLYQLPQGNQPYDDSIVEFYKKYGSYALYKFSSADVNGGTLLRLNDSALLGDPAYAGKAFSFFKANSIAYYPEKFVQQTMPRIILLSAGLFTKNKVNAFAPVPMQCHSTDKVLILGFANKSMDTASVATLKNYIGGIHRYYAYSAIYNGHIQVPASFKALFPLYIPNAREGHPEDYLSIGILEYIYLADYTVDFSGFVGLIASTTAEEREAGVLSPAVDVSGNLRKKCEIVARYYKDTLGIDLVAIGNSRPVL
jgi:hypothetical protein